MTAIRAAILDLLAALVAGAPPPGRFEPKRATASGARTPAISVATTATLALAFLALAEVTTVFVDVRWGIVAHAALFVALITQGTLAIYASTTTTRPLANFVTALALAPLTRIVSLALPLTAFPRETWLAVVAVPMLVAVWTATRATGYGRRDLGLWLDRRPRGLITTFVIGSIGVAIGYIEYRILTPEPLVDPFAAGPVAVAAASLLIGTGLAEELVFRGVVLWASIHVLGTRFGLVYAAAIVATLHAGHRSLLDLGFVFAVAIAFGVVAVRTRSLAGVVMAHGVTNIALFILYPLLLGTS